MYKVVSKDIILMPLANKRNGGVVGAVVRSTPFNHKVLGSNPGAAECCSNINFVFSDKADSAFHPYRVGKMSTSFCCGLTCDGLVSCPGGVNDSHPLNTTETGDKRRLQLAI